MNEEVIEKLKKEIAKLRYLLWLRHGCDGFYGDDGEMQCNKCMIDFKRDSIEKIEKIFHDKMEGEISLEDKEMHRERHVELHKKLDELVADFISSKSNRGATIIELMCWSYEQTLKPTEKGEKNGRSNGQVKNESSNEEGD